MPKKLRKYVKKTMQGQILQKALDEAGINTRNIDVDHRTGINVVNGVRLEIKYPLSFIEKINLLNKEKIYRYGFQGTTFFRLASLNREEILKPYYQPENKIVSTDVGLSRGDKSEFDTEFYQLMCNSYFALSPNWGGVGWDHDDAWTYRFIEAAFCKSIPVVFKETPLSKKFTDGITFFWNDVYHTDVENYYDIVEQNYKNAVKKWTLQKEEIDKILGSI